VQDGADGHVDGNAEAAKKGECARWLRDWHHGVHEGVQDAAGSEGAEQVDGHEGRRVGQAIEQTGHPEGWDVLQVIQMGPSGPFYVGVNDSDFAVLVLAVLRVRKHVLRKSLFAREDHHKEELEHKDAAVEDVPPENRVVDGPRCVDWRHGYNSP